jgi:hypothetical protein
MVTSQKLLNSKLLFNNSHTKHQTGVKYGFQVPGESCASCLVMGQEELPQKDFFTKTIYSPEIEKIEKKGKLSEFPDAVKQMLGNIIRCKKGVYLMPTDPHGHPLLKKPVRDTCDNKFCDCEYCVESRKIKARKRLEEYPIFKKDSKEKGFRSKKDKAVHLHIDFNITFENTDEEKKEREKTLKNIRRDFERKGFNLIGVMVFDIKGKDKRGKIIYYKHYHLALYPPRFWETFKKVCGALTEKYKGKAIIKNEGFKPKKSLVNYFVKIIAGQISGDAYGIEEHHTLLYKDIMSPEDYNKFFLHKQVLRYVGYDKKKGVKCVYHAERSESVNNLYCLGQRLPKKCPVCGWEVDRSKIKIKKTFEDDPPPLENQIYRGETKEIFNREFGKC